MKERVAKFLKSLDKPHKWACVLMLYLAYRAGTGGDAAVAESTYKYMILTFVVVGGYARAPEILGALIGKSPVSQQ